MENFEATETKKKNKIRISDIVFIGILAVLLGFFAYLETVRRELFLFGYVWYSTNIGLFLNALMAVYMFLSWTGQPKSKKRTVCIIDCIAVFILAVCGLFYSAHENIKNTIDTERIMLSDGNEIIFEEYITHNEYTYINVYQVNGVTAKRIGFISENSFSNKCILQDKYSYEYDEENKKLTVICEHGSESLEKQNGTGFWEGKFTLE